MAVRGFVVQNNGGCRGSSQQQPYRCAAESLQIPRLNDNRLRAVSGAVRFDGRVLLAETIQKDPRRRVGMRVSCVSEAAVTPFQCESM